MKISFEQIFHVIRLKDKSHRVKEACENAVKYLLKYISAINSFCLFFEREHILCSEVTVKTMKAFEEFLSEKKRAQSLYTSKIVRLFNEHT